jgi:hypothetical protein
VATASSPTFSYKSAPLFEIVNRGLTMGDVLVSFLVFLDKVVRDNKTTGKKKLIILKSVEVKNLGGAQTAHSSQVRVS